MIQSNNRFSNKCNSNQSTISTRNSIKNKGNKPLLYPILKEENNYQSPYSQFFQEDYDQENDNANAYSNTIKGISQKEILSYIQFYPLLYEVYLKNSNKPQIHNKIVNTFLKKPSASDCPGYIYGFMNFHQNSPYDKKHFIKMGRTKHQIPQVRIFQWQKQDNHQYTQIFTVRSQFNNKLQSLVHLFFDYARQQRQINGQRRIQWFYFQDRVLTAAAVNMINEIMYKIHRPELRNKNNNIIQENLNNQTVNQHHGLNIKQILKLSIQKIKKFDIQKISQKRLVLVGLDPEVLLNVKCLYQGNQLKFLHKTLLSYEFKSQLNQHKDNIDFTVDILSLDKQNISIDNTIIENFSQWVKIFASKQIQINIVIKQSDIQSSNLSALIDILQVLKNINVIRQKISVCVFLTDKGIQIKDIKDFILQKGSKILTFEYKKVIKEADFHLIYKPEKQGTKLNLQAKEYQKIKQKFDAIKKSYSSLLEFFYLSLKKEANGIADQIVFDTSQIFDKQFQKTVRKFKFKTSLQKINKLSVMTQLIEKILSQSTYQHQIFISLNQLLKQLQITFTQSPLDWTKIMMFAFCTCIMNRNLNQAKFLEKLKIQIKNQQNYLGQLMNVQINSRIQQIYKNINQYLNTIKVKSIYEQKQNIDIFNQLINFFEELKGKYFEREEQFMEFLTKNQILIKFQQFQKIIKLVQQVIHFESKGIRCNRVYSKLKQFGIKIVKQWGMHKISKSQQKKERKNIKKQTPVKIESEKKKQPQQYNKKQDFFQFSQDNDFEKIQSTLNSSNQVVLSAKKQKTNKNKKDSQHTMQINNIRQLIYKNNRLDDQDSVMNICKESFHLNFKEDAQIKHSTIILAKSVKISEKIQIKFENKLKQDGQKKKKKKYFIIISQNYQGVEHINLMKSDYWNICLVYFNKDQKPKMIINKHSEKIIEKLKINNLIQFYRKSIE